MPLNTQQIPSTCPAARASKMPPVVKYFLLGGICALLGTTWSGVHLWLALNGQISALSAISYQRQLHLMLQLYFFLGCFISGYLLQAGSKLFNLSWQRARFDFPVFSLQLASLVLIVREPSSAIGRLLFSASLLLVLLQIATWWWSNRSNNIGIFLPIASGLVVLALGTQLTLENPLYSLAVVWFGLVPIILASAQQFIQGFLGGNKLTERDSLILGVGYLLSIPIFFELLQPEPERLLWHVWSGLALMIFAFYFYRTKVLLKAWNKRGDIIGFALISGAFWLISGSVSLALFSNPADGVLHCWCIGVAGTLTLAASSRIIGFLARNAFPKEPFILVSLWLWQVVALGRCKIIALPAWFSWISGISASVALAIWLIVLFARSAEIYKAKPEATNMHKKQTTLKIYQGA